MHYGYQTWSEEHLMQVYDDGDLYGGQKSLVVKCDKLCAIVTKLGRQNPWSKFLMIMTFMEVKGQQRSNVVNHALWLPYLIKRIADASLKWLWSS